MHKQTVQEKNRRTLPMTKIKKTKRSALLLLSALGVLAYSASSFAAGKLIFSKVSESGKSIRWICECEESSESFEFWAPSHLLNNAANACDAGCGLRPLDDGPRVFDRKETNPLKEEK
jgi:hypothetical protein